MTHTAEEVRGAIARGWCSKANAHKEMDATLADAIAQEVLKMLERREAGVTDERTKFSEWWRSSKYCQVVYSGPAPQQVAWDAWQASQLDIWPVAAEPAQTKDPIRHHLRWALDVMSEHGLTEFSLRVQQMHKEATKVLAATEPVDDGDDDESSVAAERVPDGYAKSEEITEYRRIAARTLGTLGGGVAVFLSDKLDRTYTVPVYFGPIEAPQPGEPNTAQESQSNG